MHGEKSGNPRREAAQSPQRGDFRPPERAGQHSYGERHNECAREVSERKRLNKEVRVERRTLVCEPGLMEP